MTRLSDEEIVNKCFVIPRMALPTEKADTVRGWKRAEVFYIPQIEKLQGEIAQLTAKHERLVKEITPFFKRMEFPRYDENETNDYICNSGDFDKAMCAYKLALTEEGNV